MQAWEMLVTPDLSQAGMAFRGCGETIAKGHCTEMQGVRQWMSELLLQVGLEARGPPNKGKLPVMRRVELGRGLVPRRSHAQGMRTHQCGMHTVVAVDPLA